MQNSNIEGDGEAGGTCGVNKEGLKRPTEEADGKSEPREESILRQEVK